MKHSINLDVLPSEEQQEGTRVKIYDALAERYGIDSETIKRAILYYNNMGDAPYSERVRRVRMLIHECGYTGYRYRDVVDNLFKHRD